MQRLDEKTWIDKKIPEVFEHVQRGKRLKNADHVPGVMPYVSSTANNNGVDDYIEATPRTRVFSDCISLANSGSVGNAFYEPFHYVASDHVTSLKKEGLTAQQYLFLTSVVEKQGVNFNFNREINNARISNMRVLLPVTDNGEPDYEYMEQYAAEARKVKLEKYLEYVQKRIDKLGDYVNIPSLDEKEYTKFKAFGDHGLFEIAATSSSIDGIRLKIGKDQSLPYITRTNNGNGIARFVSENNMVFGYDDAGCITVGLDTQTAFYQPHKFVTGQNIQVITGGMFNEYLAQFIIPLMRIQMKAKFNWGGNGATLGRMKTLELMLPVNDSGEPDFEYMEQYSKNMMLRKYQQYLAFLDTKR